MTLVVDGRSHGVAQVGGGRLYFPGEGVVIGPADRAEFVLSIDGHEQRWAVTMDPGNGLPRREIKASFQLID